jgi:site-specific DNA-methyltransferase (adenine-specific)
MSVERAPRNRTISVSASERDALQARLLQVDRPVRLNDITDRVLHGDAMEAIHCLPDQMADLLILDPPYNRNKVYNGNNFKRLSTDSYERLVESWVSAIAPKVKPRGSVYVCCDWQISGLVHEVLGKHFKIRNRITWEREKGRGSKNNWKNCSEDIWYAVASNDSTFNHSRVMLKKRVIAPYRQASGQPKDWVEADEGNFRFTYPSNLWTDITVPFWSMPENTDHPTQKPEKLIAKLILASSNHGDLVLDPFLGSGTTAVVAKKLGRRYCGIELDLEYCLLAEKRLERAAVDKRIQGFDGGVFWERNSSSQTNGSSRKVTNGPKPPMQERLV